MRMFALPRVRVRLPQDGLAERIRSALKGRILTPDEIASELNEPIHRIYRSLRQMISPRSGGLGYQPGNPRRYYVRTPQSQQQNEAIARAITIGRGMANWPSNRSRAS